MWYNDIMSADIVNWLQVNILGNTQVIRSLIALIILVVAIFFFSEKPMEKNTFRRSLGASLFVFAIFVFLFANITDLADVFTAWATIVLAGIAALSFEESRRLRKQYKAREERDRKERIIRDIVEWAAGIDIIFLGTNAKNISGLPLLDVKNIALRTISSCSSTLAKGSYFGTLASKSFKSTDVREDIDSINVNLDAIIYIKKKELGYPNQEVRFDRNIKLKALCDDEQNNIKLSEKLVEFTIEYGNELVDSINTLFKHAANIISH